MLKADGEQFLLESYERYLEGEACGGMEIGQIFVYWWISFHTVSFGMYPK